MTGRGTIVDYDPVILATGFADALELWDALVAFYLERRPRRESITRAYPETTVLDVHQVAGLFSAELTKAPKDSFGHAGAAGRWRSYQADIVRLTGGRRSGEEYADNERFWNRETRGLAIDLSTANALPTKSEIVLDAVRGAVTMPVSYLPAGVGDVLDGVADTVGGAIDSGGDILGAGIDVLGDVGSAIAGHAKDLPGQVRDGAMEVAGGLKDVLKASVGGLADAVIVPLVDTVGKPLLIGAAVVGGILIVPKLLDDRKGRKAA